MLLKLGVFFIAIGVVKLCIALGMHIEKRKEV